MSFGACLIIVCCVVFAIFAWMATKEAIDDAQRIESDSVLSAVEKASKQTLQEAAVTLANAGICYSHPYLTIPNCLKLPKSFWGTGYIHFKAKALITLMVYDKSLDATGQSQCVLAELLTKQAVKTPGVVLAIVGDMASQTDRSEYLKFYNRLPFAGHHVVQ